MSKKKSAFNAYVFTFILGVAAGAAATHYEIWQLALDESSEAGAHLRDKASGAKEKLGEGLSEAGEIAKDKASDAKDATIETVKEKSRDAVDSVKETVEKTSANAKAGAKAKAREAVDAAFDEP